MRFSFTRSLSTVLAISSVLVFFPTHPASASESDGTCGDIDDWKEGVVMYHGTAGSHTPWVRHANQRNSQETRELDEMYDHFGGFFNTYRHGTCD